MDIAAIIDYWVGQEAYANDLWSKFEKAFASLRKFPMRGHIPPELAEYPDKRIREIHVNPYRLIYRIMDKQLYILFVVDGRRDIQSSLMERALRFGFSTGFSES